MRGGAVLTVRSGPAAGLTALVALLAALGMIVGLSGSSWVVGLTCGVVLNAAVARGLARSGADALGPADLVTLTRATLACGVAALTADSFLRQPAVTTLVALALVALLLDAIDGWVARHTRTASVFGARFDGEVDAFLMLVLSVYVARAAGWWVLAIGVARYAFAAAGWALPWLRVRLPARYWRRVVAAIQGVVLTVAAAAVLPRWLTAAALVVALALLAESFGRDVRWLWRHRRAELAGEDVHLGGRRGLRAVVAAVANVLAVLLVWSAFLAPTQASHLTPGAFARIPVEGLVLAVLALVLPRVARRTMAAVVGVFLGLLTVVKILDIGFFAIIDRPFSVVTDRGYFVPAVLFVSDSIGQVGATLAVVAAGVLVVAVLVCVPLAVGRVTGLVARHHRWSVRTVTGLVVIWTACAASGLQVGPGEPIASADAGQLVVGKVRGIADDVHDVQRFEASAAADHYPNKADLLAGLRGKDVLVVFVESYGRFALEDRQRVQAVVDAGTRRLGASGFSSRSAYLTSPAFGAASWLAHSTLQSGLWVDNNLVYQQLLESNRMSLSRAFGREGWRTVAVMPSNREEWPEGKAFYQLDKIYSRSNLNYRGPSFGFSAMPDQYTLSAFQRMELAKRDRPPVMAEINLASSHQMWAHLPHMIEWNRLGDGSVFHRIKSKRQVWQGPEELEAAYLKSIVYCLRTVTSFVEKYGDDDTVLILLGDHQPPSIVSGDAEDRDVPITVIARDPAVIDRISGWGWQDGMRPDSQAPVWPMDAFRDRFLAAYSPVRTEQP